MLDRARRTVSQSKECVAESKNLQEICVTILDEIKERRKSAYGARREHSSAPRGAAALPRGAGYGSQPECRVRNQSSAVWRFARLPKPG